MGEISAVTVLVPEGSATAEIMLAGRVDRSADALLDEALESLLVDPRVRRIEVDVALVDSCDYGGLTVFIRAQHLAADFGVPLRLVQAGPLLLRVLNATGLSRLLTAA
jgi:anti-anti-sigma factor